MRLPAMEGDARQESNSLVEWIIRLALVALAVAGVWTVFGDEIGQFLGR